MFEKISYVYILASRRNGTLYTGITSNLSRRMYEHKNGVFEGFTKKYNVHILVYFEQSHSITQAIEREKQIKNYSRRKKLELIEEDNPTWKDFSHLC